MVNLAEYYIDVQTINFLSSVDQTRVAADMLQNMCHVLTNERNADSVISDDQIALIINTLKRNNVLLKIDPSNEAITSESPVDFFNIKPTKTDVV